MKHGEFDMELVKSIVLNERVDQINQYESNQGIIYDLLGSFIEGFTWEDKIGTFDQMLTYTKDDIVKNMICVPVFDVEGRVIAVIQAINKLERGVPGRISNLMRRSTLSFGKSLRSKYSNRFLNCIL